ncbi:MAG: tetratricopeptide repeat protein [Polyangiaceae bacterium]
MTNWKTVLLASGCSVLTAGCMAESAGPPPQLTSARMTTATQNTEAERDLSSGEVAKAVAAAEREESLAPRDPWAHYDRAVTLEQMGRVDDAVKEFQAAEDRFTGAGGKGEAISLYGRAHALASVGRCREAKTAYEEYASFVRSDSPAKAEMALRYAGDCIEMLVSDPMTEAVAVAVVAGDYARAVSLSPEGGNAWLDYDRAVAFAALRRTDDAVASFRSAEREFGDLQERSIAVYGRARALNDALRCTEARQAYDEYAALVGATNPRDAEMAQTYARDCRGPYHW